MLQAKKKANEISDMTIIGDVKGKDVVIIDDMIDTAGTLTKSAQLFMDYGAKSVSFVVLMPYFLDLHTKELKIVFLRNWLLPILLN